MRLAAEYGLKSIAFPAISTGVYGIRNRSMQIAVTAVIEFMLETGYLVEVRFVLFDKENYDLYNAFLNHSRVSQ
jgi:O-acetyl-ADP-ribose deacetylase (regulator of RNase III)